MQVAVMVANAAIEIAWISATVYLVISGHGGWAVATFIGALFCGYTVKRKEGSCK
jgi:hypothetical protein